MEENRAKNYGGEISLKEPSKYMKIQRLTASKTTPFAKGGHTQDLNSSKSEGTGQISTYV